MHDHQETGSAFAIPDLWENSPFADFERYENGPSTEDRGAPFATLKSMNNQLDSKSEKLFGIPSSSENATPENYFSSSFTFPHPQELDLHLPSLISFDYGPLENLEDLEPPSASSIAGSIGSLSCQGEEEEDIWSATQIIDPDPGPAEFKSWERFHNTASKEPRTAYLSEGGPSAFDAAVVSHLKGSRPDLPIELAGPVLQCGPVLHSLLQLAQGRESLLYRWVEQKNSFRPHVEGGRMSGYTPETFHSLTETFISYGKQMRNLHSFVNESYLSHEPFPSLIAVADGCSKILTALEAQLSPLSTIISSLLQAQYLFHRPSVILSCLSDIAAMSNTTKSDGELLSNLYSLVQEVEHSTPWLRPMACRILAHASKPWLESVSGSIGLQTQLYSGTQGIQGNFVLPREGFRKDVDKKGLQEPDLDFVNDSMPNFVTSDDAHSIFETGLGLRLLRNHKPEHPLGKLESLSSIERPTLEWQFSWKDVERIQARMKNYESNLLEVMQQFNMNENQVQAAQVERRMSQRISTGPFGVSLETIQEKFDRSTKDMEKPFPDLGSGRDPLSETVIHCTALHNEILEEEAALFAPSVSLVPRLSFSPVLSTQARLVNKACLRLLFKEHKLRLHLSLQHRYHLFGDGIFASRLSHALFDPELQTAERRKGHSRSGVSGVSGLKLGSRDSWPPASSELRLVLMGILSESYYRNREFGSSSSRGAELPGGLSFAIREMPEDELQRCLDPDSIEALDFLRLQYKPPPPLDVVITTSSLSKYDCIFKLLLRAARMMFVVSGLFPGRIERHLQLRKTVTQRFTIEAHHFVSATCSYFFNGVMDNWAIFERKLEKIEKQLDRHDVGNTEGIHSLRKYHEKILDRIMFALILRKRQEQVMKLLEETFSSVLKFANSLQNYNATTETEMREKETQVAEIYEVFKKKVRVFISVCRGLGEPRGRGGKKRHDGPDEELFAREDADEDGGNTIGQLLLGLEMSGYYSKSAR